MDPVQPWTVITWNTGTLDSVDILYVVYSIVNIVHLYLTTIKCNNFDLCFIVIYTMQINV